MPRRARKAVLVVPLLVVASAAASGCDIAMADYKQRETAEWRKTYELQPGGRLEISNINGRITVEPSTGNAVEIVAQKSARAASVEAAREALGRIEIQETAPRPTCESKRKCSATVAACSAGPATRSNTP
jgi:hypothetical protein